MTRGPTGERYRVIQIHPTRRCNLTCAHCYSLSGPEERGELGAALLGEALADAAAEGYAVASFSGGEPTLYRPLVDVLSAAHNVGLLTTVTTNGMLLTERRVSELAPQLDLLAISLDGKPESHNRMRGSDLAFEKMNRQLEHVRSSGIPFGFIFTLTQRNMDELDWVADYAVDAGAALLQVHPLEEVGRAASTLPGERPDATECLVASLVVRELQARVGEQLRVHLDIVDLQLAARQPDAVYAGSTETDPNVLLADLVSPLVVEADGHVVPLSYGFARRYGLGDLHQQPLRQLAQLWRIHKRSAFSDLCRRTYAELNDPDHTSRFTNWYEDIRELATAANR
jgi:MoaA/NifB/PqqE/SkfB family radical SAM enzyme